MSNNFLEVKNVSKKFGHFTAVNDVSFSLQKGKAFALLGESGCGKSVTALSIMNLIDLPGRINSGNIYFKKNDKVIDITELGKMSKKMRSIRGKEISMIFQDPMSSLNPVLTIGDQVIETIRLHKKITKRNAYLETIDLLNNVGLPSPKKTIKNLS